MQQQEQELPYVNDDKGAKTPPSSNNGPSRKQVIGTLMRKNILLKRRHPFQTLSELLAPLLCIIFFAAIKCMDSSMDIPSGWSSQVENTSYPTHGSSMSLFEEQDLFSSFVDAVLSASGSIGSTASTRMGTKTSTSSSWEAGSQSTNGSVSDIKSTSEVPSSLVSASNDLLTMLNLKTPRYFFTETTMTGLIVNLALQSILEADRFDELDRSDAITCFSKFVLFGFTSLDPKSPFAVPPECKGKVVPYKLAVAPDNLYTRQYFSALLKKWYPRTSLVNLLPSISLFNVPSFEESSLFYQNEQAFESYIASKEYGSNLSYPKIYAGIIFVKYPNTSEAIGQLSSEIEYSLRFNSTSTEENLPGSVPRTLKKHYVNQFKKSISPLYLSSYATRGFMTLQTLVTRFLICLPDWNITTSKSTGMCQVKEAIAKSNASIDARFLRQVHNDLVLRSVLEIANRTLQALKQEQKNASVISNLNGLDRVFGILNTGSSQRNAFFMDPLKKAFEKLEVTFQNIPISSQEKLLIPLRHAPQPYHGANAFVTPNDQYIFWKFYDKLLIAFPMGIFFASLFGVSCIIVAFLQEKETKKIFFLQIITGISCFENICSWYFIYGIILTCSAFLQAFASIQLLFIHSSFYLVWLFFWFFHLNCLSFGFLMSNFFFHAKTGAFMGMGIFFLMLFVATSFTEETTEATKILACILPPVAFVQGLEILVLLEAMSIGVTNENAWKPISEHEVDFRFGITIVMLLVDFCLYTCVALVLEQCKRSYQVETIQELIIAWKFNIQRRFTRISSVDTDMIKTLQQQQQQQQHQRQRQAHELDVFETIDRVDLVQQEQDGRALKVQNMYKFFDVPSFKKETFCNKKKKKIALDDINLTFYQDQITCLLGQNGAGKTTLIGILTGLIKPTHGNAFIQGLSIQKDMPKIRQLVGFCPQQSILYEELTVQEHLELIGLLQGTKMKNIQKEIEVKLQEIGLTEKRHVKAIALSGGMKRKLSLAIAFFGNNRRVIFLDEPTSGMDPYSRRSLWELILKHKANRIMILTTHFMDEADLLGDRIAIMAQGKVKCVGSSLFLKKRFGAGYKLTLVLKQQSSCTQKIQVIKKEADNEKINAIRNNKFLIETFVRNFVPQANISSYIGTEMTIQLPFEASSTFSALFHEFDSQKVRDKFDIVSYGISVTTLEEIFLRVAAETTHEDHASTNTSSSTATSTMIAAQNTSSLSSFKLNVNPEVDVTSIPKSGKTSSLSFPVSCAQMDAFVTVFWYHWKALFLKRVLTAKRDKSMVFFSMFLPCILLAGGFASLQMSIYAQNDPKMILHTTQLPLHENTPVLYTCSSNQIQTIHEQACREVMMSAYFTDAKPVFLPIDNLQPINETFPVAFGIKYNFSSTQPPEMQIYDTNLQCLRFAQAMYERGYGQANSNSAFPDKSNLTQPFVGQFGGLVMYVSEQERIFAYNLAVNSSSIHGAVLLKALIDQAIYRKLMTQSFPQKKINLSIQVNSYPFPLSYRTKNIFNSFLSVTAVLFLLFAFTFFPASIIPFLIKEKWYQSNAKHQQLISGVSLVAFWVANACFDFILYLVPMTMSLVFLSIFKVTSLMNFENITTTNGEICPGCPSHAFETIFLLFFLFGTAIIPWTYLFSHVFKDPSSCLLYTVMMNFLCGLLWLMLSFILDSFEETMETNKKLMYFWRLSPFFNLGNGFVNIIVEEITALFGLRNKPQSAWSTDIAGIELIYLAIETFVYFGMTLWIDIMKRQSGEKTNLFCHRFFRRLIQKKKNQAIEQQEEDEMEDEDVKNEANRVTTSLLPSGNKSRINSTRNQKVMDEITKPSTGDPFSFSSSSTDHIRLINLKKIYPNGKFAVRNISFGLSRGDCFGFLGINGAGKTTTMKILTGNLAPSSGRAILDQDIDLFTKRSNIQIGYCPQFDALIDNLTVREHLELFSRLKLSQCLTTATLKTTLERNVAKEVDRLIQELTLKPFEHKLAGTLSGGNKRKLSVAIAMVNCPSLLFLDEPSTGMDPFSKRFLWDVILKASVLTKNSTIFLTTHSMEESEALCNKASIMVNGKLKCFGSIQHLKNRFGKGFLLEFKLNLPTKNQIQDTLKSMNDQKKQEEDGPLDQEEMKNLCRRLLLSSSKESLFLLEDLIERKEIVGKRMIWFRFEVVKWILIEMWMEHLINYLQQYFGKTCVQVMKKQMDFCRIQMSTHRSSSHSSKGNETNNENEKNNETMILLSQIFDVIENAKNKYHIKDYSVSQTTLEQIFHSFARLQKK